MRFPTINVPNYFLPCMPIVSGLALPMGHNPTHPRSFMETLGIRSEAELKGLSLFLTNLRFIRDIKMKFQHCQFNLQKMATSESKSGSNLSDKKAQGLHGKGMYITRIIVIISCKLAQVCVKPAV